MRQGLIWIVLLIAAAAVGWMLFGGGGGDDGGGEYADGLPDDGDESAGPGLKGAGGATSGVPRVPTDIRGRCTIQGTARRGGDAVAATVELRHVQEIDPRDPFKGGVETQFIARLLDGGMSSKDVIARVETDGDGTFAFRGLATGLYEIRATVADGAMGFTTAALPAAGARVEALVDIPEGDQTLSGRVVYADGKPFKGTVLASMGNAFAMMMGMGSKSMPAYTDEDGRFKIAGLSPSKYQISALIPGVMRVMGAPITVPYSGEYTLTINAEGTEIKGKVIDAETEQPIPGATVFGGGGDPEASFSIFTTKSDADGAFALTIPVGRGGGMFVRADGYAAQTLDFNSGRGADDLVMVSLLKLAKIEGRVTAKEGGSPVAGITVFAMGAGGGRGMMGAPSSAITDADGRYAIPGIDPGSVRAWAVGAGYASSGLTGSGMIAANTPYTIELEPGQSGTLDLEAVAAGQVEGSVKDESGRAIPGAIVQASAEGNMGPQFAAAFMGMGASWGTAVTDTDGAYAIDVLVPGTKYKITVKAPDHPTASSDAFVAVGGKTETVDITMKSPRWIDVKVVDKENGQPVAGVSLLAVPKQGGREMMMELIGGGAMWTTGKDGMARIGPLADGELRMQATAGGYVDMNQDIPDGEKGPITLEIQKGLVIAGTIELPEGVPVQGIRVRVSRSGGNSGWFQKRATVQADGSWRVDTIVDEGEYDINARGEWKENVYNANLKASTGDENVVLRLEASAKEKRETITVTVIDADGKPVPTGRVQLTRTEGTSTSSHRTRLSAGKAQVRGFSSQPGSEIWVEVYELVGNKRGATIQGPVTITDGKLEVRLGASRSISGMVVDQDGAAVPSAKLTAQAFFPGDREREGEEHGTAVTDDKGRFEIRGLGDLEYKLSVEAPSDYAPVESQTVQAGASNLTFTARVGMRATLTVLDFEGQPVSGANIWAQQLDKDGKRVGGFRFTGNSTTDSDGQFTLKGLLEGAQYALTISAPQGRSELKRISVQRWDPKDETFTFKRAYSIQGTVVDTSGKPLPNVRVQRRKTGEKSFSGWDRTDNQGKFAITDLEAGEYELRVRSESIMTMATPNGGTEEPGFVKARAGATNVKLVADLGLKLVVTIRSGKASDRMRQAYLRTSQGQMLNGTWRNTTVVEFQGLREGSTYTLWIGGLQDGKYAAQDGIEGHGGDIEVEAQSGGVIEGTIKLPAGQTFRNIHVSAANALGQSVSAQVNKTTGKFRLEGLPHEQTYQLHAHGWVDGGGHWQGTGSGTTGANVTIELKKR